MVHPNSPQDSSSVKCLTADLLSYDGPRGILVGLVLEVVGILERSAEFRIDPEADVTEGKTRSGGGIALSPAHAALCSDEPRRTAMFLRGVNDAILEALAMRKSPDEPIQVLYAGTGPFGTLVIPLMTVFPPEDVRFTMLDIHAVSIDSVKSIVRRLKLDKSVASYVVADACAYCIPENEIPEVIVSETMDAALESEPQVAIMRHLLGQAPGARLVPESVRVDAVLLDTSSEPGVVEPDLENSIPASSPDRIPFGSVFTLDAEAIKSWACLTGERLPAGSLEVPRSPGSHYKPFFFTTIITHGDHILRTHDSGLTSPRAFPGDGELTSGELVHFHYRLGRSPGLGYSSGES